MISELVSSGARALGLSLPEGAAEACERVCCLLLKRNRQFNLTAVQSEEEAARLHFLDSLALLTLRDLRERSVIDVGSGAGFPGLPIAIGEPSARVTLLDSTGKKVRYLEEAVGIAGVSAQPVLGRAEELGRTPEYRERYDCAVSRAVARLNVLCELCLPFVAVGGAFLAMKAADSDGELSEAESAIQALGGRLADVKSYQIPGTDVTRRVAVIEKVSSTPERYPRRFARIQADPL